MEKLYKNISRLLCLLILGGIAVPASADDIYTSDHFEISGLKTDSDGTYFTVSLAGGDQDRKYCAYNMTINLPLGLTFAKEDGDVMIFCTKDNTFYPNKRGDLLHFFQSAIPQDCTSENVAKIACYGTTENFLSTSGELFDVYIDISPWAKAGENEIEMTGLNLTTSAAQKYVPNGNLNTGTIDISGDDRKVGIDITSANKWGTCILPFEYTPGTDFKAYSVKSVTTDEVFLTQVDKMEAYKPYILNAESGYSAILKGTALGSDFPGEAIVNVNGLCGSIVPGEASAGYILQNQNNGQGAMFYQIGSTPFSIKAGKCYLAPVSSGSYMLRIRREETAIEDITFENEDNDVYFNISGQRVSNLETGIFIHNGKKQFKSR